MELPGVRRAPGRPASGLAKSNKERQAAYRRRHAVVEVGGSIPATIKKLADQFDLTTQQVTRELLRFALCNKNWSSFGFPSARGSDEH